ncbi:MAG: hypothetical protein NTY42_05285 [Planctomycetota bacterium]|nr:hypothetical protein [Planctomycetota bacterium]
MACPSEYSYDVACPRWTVAVTSNDGTRKTSPRGSSAWDGGQIAHPDHRSTQASCEWWRPRIDARDLVAAMAPRRRAAW